MRDLRDPRHPLTFALLVVVGITVARFLAVGLHEIVGHGAFAVAVGGAFYGVYVSPATGVAFVFLPPESPPAAEALVALAGILVSVLAGAAVYAMRSWARTFVGRLFVLLALQVLLVYSFAYLALGAFTAGGDPAEAAEAFGLPALAFGFLAVGGPWVAFLVLHLSHQVVRFVQPAKGSEWSYVLLFWLAPLPLAAFPAAFARPDAGSVTVLGIALLGVAAILVLALRLTPEPKPVELPSGRIAPLAIAFLVVVPVWIGAFGLAGSTAHGVLFAEPPLEAERAWADPHLVNVRVALAADGTVTLEIRLKGVRDVRSPLEQEAVGTYETRADFGYWSFVAREIAAAMTGGANWTVTSAEIDATGTAWYANGEPPNPRVVRLALGSPAETSRFLNATQVDGPSGPRTAFTLTITDPFPNLPNECEECFVDEVNLTWAGGTPEPYRLVSVTANGTPEGLIGSHFAQYRTRTPDEAPASYVLVVEVVP